jgi:SAM-dependent methyltransferase
MPFDQETYDGVFCYALIHLLPANERAKLISDCYNQLRPGGYMVFVAISKSTAAYGQGAEVSKDTFLTPHGVTIFYYDADAIDTEFGGYGLLEATELSEPAKPTPDKPSQRFWRITCKK